MGMSEMEKVAKTRDYRGQRLSQKYKERAFRVSS